MNNYLKESFEKLGKTQKEIIEDLGKSQPYVSALMKGKKSVGRNVAKELSELYGFDYASILEGKMLNNQQDIVNEGSPTYGLKTNRRVKKQLYYPDVVVTNSDVEMFESLSASNIEVREMYDPNLEGADIVLPNFGNSNTPYIQPGDLVGYRKLQVQSYESLNLNLMYMIITVNNQRMNKKLQVYKDDNKKLWCISMNKEEHKPFPILKKDIVEIWEIVGVSRRFN